MPTLAAAPSRHSRLARQALAWGGVLVAYTAAGKLGLALAFINASATAVWPPTGIAIAALLLFGYRIWPAVFVGAFIVNETTTGSAMTSFAIAAGNTAEALLGAHLTDRYARGYRAFSTERDFLRFVLLAGLSTTVSATVGATTLALGGFLDPGTYGRVWMTWWLGDTTGAIVVTPVLVLWCLDPRLRWSRAQRIEIALLFGVLAITAWMIFFRTSYPLGFLCVLPCGWAAFRFGQREAATATCVLAAIAIAGTIRGAGSFGVYPPNDALLLLHLFMAVTMVGGIVLGAAVDERRQAEAEVRLLNADLEQRVRARTTGLQKALDDVTVLEHRLEEAQAVAHTGSWEWTPADNHVWWSKELHRIYGLDAASHDGFLAIVHPQDRQRIHDIARRALENREPFEYEHRVVGADGEIRTVYARGRAVVEAGRVVRLIGTAQDITERKRMEAQLFVAQKREAIGRLVSGVAHDFNNLLTAISGYADLGLEAADASPQQRHDLLEIKRASQRATALTKQLLSFSQQHIIEPRVIDINGVIEALVTMLRRLIGENILVKTSLAANLSGIRADSSHIEQILINLAVNARDAMPRGGQIILETRNVFLDGRYGFSKPAHPPAGPYVLLAVTDTGCGMDDVVKAHAFDPFFTTKSAGQGTGLGLATVYNIVKRFAGYVWIYSEPNRGTTFKIYFPAAHASPSVVNRASEDFSATLPIGVETILLVEDDDAVRQVARSALQARGYDVLDAPTGEDGLILAQESQRHINLVVTDVIMPGLDGPALVAGLRRARPSIKALYMSGYAERAMLLQGLLAADMPFLEKPFTPAQLVRKVRMVLDTEVGVAHPSALLE